MLILAVADLGDAIFRSARLFLIEQALCRSYYQTEDPVVVAPNGSVEEYRCKSDSLQADVSMVYGLFDVLTLLCGFVATPAYTRLMSTIGLRPSLLINLSSLAVGAAYSTAVCFYQWDIRWIWLTGFFDLIGGGQPVRSALLYSYIAEVVPSNLLSETLYRLSTLVLGMAFLGRVLGAVLLSVDVWLLSGIGIAARVLIFPLAFLLATPCRLQTQVHVAFREGGQPNYGSVSQEADGQALLQAGAAHAPSVRKWTPSETLSAVVTEASQTLDLLTELLGSPLTRITLLINLFEETAINVRLAFPQWAVKRFEWSLAEANGIVSFEIVTNVTVLLLLPYISRMLLWPVLRSQQLVDLWVIKCSLALNVIGIFCAGVAPLRGFYIMSLFVYNLGAALPDALRSFVTSTMQDEEEVERLYMGISMVETIAGLLGTTVWSALFSASIRYGGTTLGRIPFFAAAVLFGLSLWLTGVLHRLAAKRQSESANMNDE
ncbi:hypothetical protein F5Y19DRAFT_464418 [Xylariaceae sp. FL1651]|nr:hypothetical protein F5Y19DRAFT_464418 [Xylariaceae sp. FL1651]